MRGQLRPAALDSVLMLNEQGPPKLALHAKKTFRPQGALHAWHVEVGRQGGDAVPPGVDAAGVLPLNPRAVKMHVRVEPVELLSFEEWNFDRSAQSHQVLCRATAKPLCINPNDLGWF
jgi:hypothetical protein